MGIKAFSPSSLSDAIETVSRTPGFALEPRILLDAAALETGIVAADAGDGEVLDKLSAEQQAPDLGQLFGSNESSRDVVFIDTGIRGYERLIQDLPADAEVFFIREGDAIGQMLSVLEGFESVDSVQIYSHGDAGALELGGSKLDLAALEASAGQWGQLGSYLSEGGDLLLYGCNVAEGEAGRSFVDRLSAITGADVAASEDLTGSTTLTDGDWDLEYSTGEVSARDVLDTLVREAFDDTLFVGWGDAEVLKPSDGTGGDEAGWSVSASDSGWVAVGGWNQQDVYMYRPRVGDGTGNPDIEYDEYKISPAGSATNGISVDVDGDFVIIGYRNSGQVYIYQYDSGTDSWQQRANFSGTAGTQGYGYDVAIEAENGRFRAAVGHPAGEGQVFTYYSTNSGASWTAGTTITRSGGVTADDQFGWSVSIDGDRLAAGAPGWSTTFTYACGYYNGDTCSDTRDDRGRVYVFSWTGNNSIAGLSTLDGPDTEFVGFGEDVDVDSGGNGNYVAIGAPDYNGNQGRAWVWREGTGLTQINSPDAGAGRFSHSISVDSDTGRLLIGQYGFNTDDGKATVYNLSGANGWNAAGTWSNGAVDTRYGHGVAMASDFAVIGAPWFDDGGTNTGQVYFRLFNSEVAPTAPVITDTISEDSGPVSYNVLGNASYDMNPNHVLVRTATAFDDGRGAVSIDANGNVIFDPLNDFDYLNNGQTVVSRGDGVVVVTYNIVDVFGNLVTGTIEINITGVNDPVTAGAGIPNRVDNADTPENITIPGNAFADIDTDDTLTFYATSGKLASGTANAISGGGSPLNYTVSGNTISYSPTAGNHQGSTYEITVWAEDDAGAMVSITFQTFIDRPNAVPVSDQDNGDPIPVLTAYEDNDQPGSFPYDVTQHFSDADEGTYPSEQLTYSIVSDHPWVSVGVLSGEMTVNPTNAQAMPPGSYDVIVRATDEFGEYAEQTITIDVINVNDAPIQQTEVPEQLAFIGLNYELRFSDDLAVPIFDDIDPTNDTVTLTAEIVDSDGSTRTLSTSGPGTGTDDYGQWLRWENLGTFDANGNPEYRLYAGGGTVSGDTLGTVIPVRITASDGQGGVTVYEFDISVYPQPGGIDFVSSATNGVQAGWDVAVSEDGQWMAVGQPRWDNGTLDRGNVRVLQWNGTSWVQRELLYADSGAPLHGFGRDAGDRFGSSVDINVTGGTVRLAVGAVGDNGHGRVYAYQWNGTNFASTATYVATDNNAGDEFGYDLAFNKDASKLLVGAIGDDQSGNGAGAAYLFNWATGVVDQTQLDKIRPEADYVGESIFFDRFGSSVAFDGNVAVIGAPWDSHNGASFAGSVTVADVNASSFGNTVKLTKGADSEAQDFFGWSVDLDVFDGGNGAHGSVVIAVGAMLDDTKAQEAGAVYTYRSDSISSTMSQTDLDSIAAWNTIVAYDGGEGEVFGVSVAVDVDGVGDVEANGGLRIAVGGDVNGNAPGALYAYRWWGADGWQGLRYEANNSGLTTTPAQNQFGWSVDIGGASGTSGGFANTATLVAGAPNADNNGNAMYGAAYAVQINSDAPIESPLSEVAAKKTAPAPDSGDNTDTPTSSELAFRSPLEQEDRLYRTGELRNVPTEDSPVGPDTGLDADMLFENEGGAEIDPGATASEALLFEERTTNNISRVDERGRNEDGERAVCEEGDEEPCSTAEEQPEKNEKAEKSAPAGNGAMSFNGQLQDVLKQRQSARALLAEKLATLRA